MSSKYIEKAWCRKTVTAEEKLLLVALAELSDRDGAFITSMSELKAMMCASESLIDNLIGKLSVDQTLIGTNKRTSSYRSDGKIKGRLNFDSYLDPASTNHVSTNNATQDMPYHSQQNAPGNPSRISSFHRSQINPLNKSTSGKVINVLELSPNVIENWAELIMFKSGFANQTNVWSSFVERVRENPSQHLFSLDELTSRLHSHLHSEKNYKQNTKRSYAPQPLRRSALEELEEKISNFNFKDDDSE
ncbi:hypothetical protein [Enterovibrio sp. 27052020O]|uniref:hypothetical protein n=1 Tax=Enterovibrio sp. 27052020O TaxID=3241166 RepID=UPI003890015E